MGLPLQDLLDVVFDICYYGHQGFNEVLEMYIYDIKWMHEKLAKVKKEELEALKQSAKK